MKLSASNIIMDERAGGASYYTPLESFTAMKEAGYDAIDVNLWQYCSKGRALWGDDFERGIDEIVAAAQTVGLPIGQTHADTLSGTQWDDPECPRRDEHPVAVLRCIEAARRLGAHTIVIHPFNLAHAPLYSEKDNREACIRYLAPFIEAAKKGGVRVAVENMVDFGRRHRRYCGGNIYELIALVDEINDPDVGICLDTGHANISGIDPAAAVRAIGKRLFATHINDNSSTLGKDAHLLPYFGDIKWEDVMRALHEIDFKGDFTYEIFVTTIPDAARLDWLKYTVAIGRHLLSI